ncbi:hypothetical protein [Rubritalea sp.]|uniref:hypothetical protein n=1 Tax=Rubritalea sp. TaxID=2109375 RepID=UPI003EF592EF
MTKLPYLVLLCSAIPFSAISADILAGYDFAENAEVSKEASGINASPIAGIGGFKNGKISNIGDTTGTAASGIRFGSTDKGSWGDSNEGMLAENIGGAIAGKNYISFTLKAGVPGTLKLGKLSFKTSRAGDKAACHYNVLAKPNGAGRWKPGHTLTSDQMTEVHQAGTSWHPTTVDLSTKPSLQNINFVEFRIYFWGGKGNAGNSRINIDNIVVEGSAAEPTSFGLISIGETSLILRDEK